MQSGGDEVSEQRVGLCRSGFELRMKLDPDKPGVVLELDDFNQISVRVNSGGNQSAVFKIGAVSIVEFIAMTGSFVDQGFPIGLMGT